LALALVLGLALGLGAACGEGGGEPGDLERQTNLRHTGASHRYIYRGVLPALEDARVVASLRAHTVRVTGLLPAAWSGQLPYYALWRELPSGRTEVSVVYPIATGVHDWQQDPGTYDDIIVLPHVPSDGKVEWGGLPYMEYNHVRAMAFHGPITHSGGLWSLRRGRVSHGCKRMQGEHAVEMAHLLGVDMTKPHGAAAKQVIKRQGVVRIISGYDTFNGQEVDVDYPALPSVQRPSARYALLFPTWDSLDYPRVVCEHRPGRALGPGHCDYMPQPSAVRDLRTGLPVGQGQPTLPFSDIRLNWAQAFVATLAHKNAVSGYPDGTFGPHRRLTRAEYAAMLHSTLGLGDAARWPTAPGRSAAHDFSDVAASHWARKAIQHAYRTGFIAGYPGNTFRPARHLTRVQALLPLVSGLALTGGDPGQLGVHFVDAHQVPGWARGAVAAARHNGLVVNYPGRKWLAPGHEATRGDVAAALVQALVHLHQAAPVPSPYLVPGG
jgi:hypothetical protein